MRAATDRSADVDETAIRLEMEARVHRYYGLSASQREEKRLAERALDTYQLRKRERYVIAIPPAA